MEDESGMLEIVTHFDNNSRMNITADETSPVPTSKDSTHLNTSGASVGTSAMPPSIYESALSPSSLKMRQPTYLTVGECVNE